MPPRGGCHAGLRLFAAVFCAAMSVRPRSLVGVFDSGVGGLSVLREIRRALPQQDLLYVADSAHAPYGDRSGDFIEQRLANHVVEDLPIEAQCARLIIDAMVRRKREVVMTFKGKWGRWVKLMAPGLVDHMALAAVKANFRPRA